MSFTQQVFIRKSTPELRDKLKKLGYRLCSCCDYLDGWLFTIEDNVHRIAEYEKEIFLEDVKFYEKSMIDCGTNEDLFLAIAALRDDSDYMQFFKITDLDTGVQLDLGVRCLRKKAIPSTFCLYKYNEYLIEKLTPQELIEYFGGNINAGSK